MKILKLLTLLTVVAIAAHMWAIHFSILSPERRFEKILEQHKINGAVIALHHADDGVKTLIFGNRRSAARDPIKPSTTFPIASLSKPITASAIRHLIKDSRLYPEQRLTDVLPDLPYPNDPRYNEITIQHLLTHTAGLPGTTKDPMFDGAMPVGCDAAIKAALRGPLHDDPGSKQNYSNTGYCILGRIIEQITGVEYSTAVLALLPKNENSLTFGPPTTSHEGEQLPSQTWKALDAAGGWFSSGPALATLYSQDALDPTIPNPMRRQGEYYYGLGWRVWPQPEGKYYLTHFGSLTETFSVALAFPDGRAAVALLNGRPTNDEASFRAIVSILQNLLEPKRQQTHPIRNNCN